MTFLAPWAMVAGVMGAIGMVLLHLVARHRPAVYVLPTARFIPDRNALASRAASRPRDLLLLLLRVLLLLFVAAAFARPALSPHRVPRARVVLVDRSSSVADPAAVWRRVRALAADESPTIVIAFDTMARVVDLRDTSAASAATTSVTSITAALVAARRAAAELAPRADSVQLVLVSPVREGELDAATARVRGSWPGAIVVDRVGARTEDRALPALERAMPITDALGPALSPWPVTAARRSVRIRRAGAADASDSAFARAGGTVVIWDSTSGPIDARGLAVGDDVIVAPLGRRTLALGGGGVVRARWADGAPAAVETTHGEGCLRTVGVGVPAAGDVALRGPVRHALRSLAAPCGTGWGAPGSATMLARLVGAGGAAPTAALAGDPSATSRIVPWLLGAALLSGLLELAVRGRGGRTNAPEDGRMGGDASAATPPIESTRERSA